MRGQQLAQQGEFQSMPTDNHIILRGQLVRTVSVQLALQKLRPAPIDQPLTHPTHQYLLLGTHRQVAPLRDPRKERRTELPEGVGLGPPAGHAEQYLDFLRREAFPLEELRVEVGPIPTEVMAARGQNAALRVALQQSAHRNVERLPAHVLADTNQLQFAELAFDGFGIRLEAALFDGRVGHGSRQHLEVEVSHVALVPLEVGVVPEELVELVPAGLPLQQYIFAVGLKLFLNFDCDGVGEHSFACAELDVDELRGHQFVLEGLVGDEFGLEVVVGHFFYVLGGGALDEGESLSFARVPLVDLDDFFDHFIQHFICNQGQVRHLQTVLRIVVLLGLVDVLGVPLAVLLLLPILYLVAVLQMLLQLPGSHEEPLLEGTLHLLLEVTAMGRAIFGPCDHCELAHPLLTDEVHLASLPLLLLSFLMHLQLVFQAGLLLDDFVGISFHLLLFNTRISCVGCSQQQNFQMSKIQKESRKELRKPVGSQFVPKRLAISFEPPTIIMEYMVLDSGKLYHHKMRLDSILKRSSSRLDVLSYIKHKHYLYFIDGKIKDNQILKFIDKILTRSRKASTLLTQTHEDPQPQPQTQHEGFSYLGEDEDYDQQYDDYEESHEKADRTCNSPHQNRCTPPAAPWQEQAGREVEEEKDDGGFEWDLELEEDADFV